MIELVLDEFNLYIPGNHVWELVAANFTTRDSDTFVPVAESVHFYGWRLGVVARAGK